MRSRRFHFAVRSERCVEPTLIWPLRQPTARSASQPSSRVARARRDDGRVALALRELERLAGIRERAGLIGLDEHRVGDARADAVCEALGRGREEVVAEQLHVCAEQLRDEPPALPVVLAQRILDRDERIATRPGRDLARQGRAVQRAILAREPVAVAVDELRGGDVERERRLDAGALDAARRRSRAPPRSTRAARPGRPRRRRAPSRSRARAARRRRRARTRAACSIASPNVVAASGITSTSCTSTARPACAPPESTLTIGRGSSGAAPGRAAARAARARPRRRRARRRPRPPAPRCRPAARGSACRRDRAGRRRSRPGRRRRSRAAARRSRR